MKALISILLIFAIVGAAVALVKIIVAAFALILGIVCLGALLSLVAK